MTQKFVRVTVKRLRLQMMLQVRPIFLRKQLCVLLNAKDNGRANAKTTLHSLTSSVSACRLRKRLPTQIK